jgi:GNAT superfamily N-acetyltransferase
MIQEKIQEANNKFFSPHSMRLDLLKNWPQFIPTLAEWLYDEWHTYDTTLTKEKLVDSFKSRMNDERIPITFVVLKNTRPIGLITLKGQTDPEFSDFPQGSIWMGSLEVVLEERGQKIGEELLKFAAGVAKGLRHEKLYFYTSNPVNISWYLKKGAEVLEERPFRNHTVTIFSFKNGAVR